MIFVGTDGRYAVWDKMRNSYEEDTLFYRKRTAKEGLEGESEEPAGASKHRRKRNRELLIASEQFQQRKRKRPYAPERHSRV